MRILLTGASGLFGLNFATAYSGEHSITGVVNQQYLMETPFQVVQVELSKAGAGGALVEQIRPDLIINCAALANLDKCESSPDLAQRLNAELPGELAQAARQVGAKLVHFSTDAVFDGQRGNYSEDDTPAPINVYSRTKLAGEAAVLAANPAAIVARVNFYGFSLFGQRSLGEFFVYNLLAGKKVMGFTDVFFCPLHVDQLAKTLLRMAELDLSGLYHVVSSQALSKYDFGTRIARQFGLDEALIQPVSWQDGGLKAARSPKLTLRTEKVAHALGEPLPDLTSGVARFFKQFQEGLPLRLRGYAGA